MKKLFVVLAVLLMLAGCTQPAVEPENTPKDTPERTAEATPTATEEPAPSPSIEPISDATIQINEGSSIMIIVSLTDGVLTGTAACFFDGTDITMEYEYILATMYVFGELDLQNYSFIGMSGEDLISIIVEDGEQSQYSKLPSKYGVLQADNERTYEYVGTILNTLNSEGESAELSSDTVSQAPQTSEKTPEITETGYVLIYEDDYVKIEYVGCEIGRFGDEIVFYVENKTSVELTFQSGTMAINGESLGYISGSESIAALSKGKIKFEPEESLPTYKPDTITGTIQVIDFSETVFGKLQYKVSFVNVVVN